MRELTVFRLFEQLKRRNVFRVAATYLALSWVLLQVVDIVLPLLGLPDSLMRTTAIILALGLIPVLVFSWIFEITPEGIQKESEIPSDSPYRLKSGHRMNVAVVFLLVIAIGLLALDHYYDDAPGNKQPVSHHPAAPGERIDSIAVLPFDDFSATGNMAYLGDGIADTIQHMLAGVEGLKVAARTSSFRFRNDNSDIETIGRQLDVESVLEGSVQVAGDQIRVIAQLIRTSDQSHMWSETFDRKMEDVFAIQDEIANAVVSQVSGDVASPKTPMRSDRTSPEIYALVLQGRQLSRNRSAPDIQRAIELLTRAVSMDAAYAAAHSELASSLYFSTIYADGDFNALRPRIEQEIETALLLDPEDYMAYAVRGKIRHSDGKTKQARDDYERSLELNPGDAEIMVALAKLLFEGGELSASSEWYQRAYETDPLNAKVRFEYAQYLMAQADDIDRAIAIAEESVALDINPTLAYDTLAVMNMRVSRLADTTIAFFEAVRHDPETAERYMRLAEWFAFLGERELTESWLEAAVSLRPQLGQREDFFFRQFLGEGEQLLAEQEQRLAANPDSIDAITSVMRTASLLGRFDRAIELGDRYFERALDDPDYSDQTTFFIEFYLSLIYRIQGISEVADDYLEQMESLPLFDLEGEELSKALGSFERVFLSLARQDYAEAARILESAPIGKPILYTMITTGAPFQLARANEDVASWIESYAAVIADARREIGLIEDPAFRDPMLLRNPPSSIEGG
jgi:TolB-like protein/tetratricopeptide (TPR) repeat protein